MCAALLLAATGCTTHADNTKGAAKRPTPPVVVASAFQQDIPLEIRAIGNGEAYSSVAIKSRVAGELMKVSIQEGADVKKGDLLFQIDPRPFEHQIDQIKATIAKDIAAEKQAVAAAARERSTAQNARSQANRYAELAKAGVVSREQNEQYDTNAQAAEDAVRADEANIAAAQEAVKVDRARLSDAELQLSYTTIRAPSPAVPVTSI